MVTVRPGIIYRQGASAGTFDPTSPPTVSPGVYVNWYDASKAANGELVNAYRGSDAGTYWTVYSGNTGSFGGFPDYSIFQVSSGPVVSPLATSTAAGGAKLPVGPVFGFTGPNAFMHLTHPQAPNYTDALALKCRVRFLSGGNGGSDPDGANVVAMCWRKPAGANFAPAEQSGIYAVVAPNRFAIYKSLPGSGGSVGTTSKLADTFLPGGALNDGQSHTVEALINGSAVAWKLDGATILSQTGLDFSGLPAGNNGFGVALGDKVDGTNAARSLELFAIAKL